MRGLKGKNVLITGASSGIGEATVIRFGQEGVNVAIHYHSGKERAKKIEETFKKSCSALEKAGCKSLLVEADISKLTEVRKMFKQVLDNWGRIDVLINNAGIQKQAPSHEMPLQDFMQVISVHLVGPYYCSREAIKHFLSRKGGGIILNNSSVHQLIPKPQFISYSLAKGAIDNLTRTLALEYADRNIRVNTVAPGAILTPINPWRKDPKAKKEVESHIPMGRAGKSEEIAGVFAFLASDDASYITGQTIFVDGGLTLFPEFKTAWSSE
ncbi:SDR family oxidoreductase [Candidatus Saccharibacteria bacterium]|nr:SDR family oxidoreductase [Candidatus Saccharibacteria bacterium]